MTFLRGGSWPRALRSYVPEYQYHTARHTTLCLLLVETVDERMSGVYLPVTVLYPFSVDTLRLLSTMLPDDVIPLTTGCLP